MIAKGYNEAAKTTNKKPTSVEIGFLRIKKFERSEFKNWDAPAAGYF